MLIVTRGCFLFSTLVNYIAKKNINSAGALASCCCAQILHMESVQLSTRKTKTQHIWNPSLHSGSQCTASDSGPEAVHVWQRCHILQRLSESLVG